MNNADLKKKILVQIPPSYDCNQLIAAIASQDYQNISLSILGSDILSSNFYVDRFENGKIINVLKDSSLAGIVKQIKGSLGEMDIYVHCLTLDKQANLERQIFSINESYWHGGELGSSKFAHVFLDEKPEDIENKRLRILSDAVKTLEKANAMSDTKREFLQVYLSKEGMGTQVGFEKNAVSKLAEAIVRPFASYIDLSNHPSLLSQRAGIMKTMFSFMESEALATALAIRLFAYLEGNPKSLDEICTSLNLEKATLQDVLGILVAIGVIQKTIGEIYSNTDKSSNYLIEGKPGYLGHYILQIWRDWFDRWHNKLLPALLDKNNHKYTSRDDYLAEFHPRTDWASAMESLSSSWAKELAQKTDLWNKYHNVLDLGSSRGLVSAIIGTQNLHLKFGLLDLSEDSKGVDSLMNEFPLMQNRYHFTQADILKTDTLPSTDTVLLGHFLHGFGKIDYKHSRKVCRILKAKWRAYHC